MGGEGSDCCLLCRCELLDNGEYVCGPGNICTDCHSAIPNVASVAEQVNRIRREYDEEQRRFKQDLLGQE